MAGDDPLGVEVQDPCAGGGDALPGSGSGSGGLSLQPGEFAKTLLAVFSAAYLAANRNALACAGRKIWRLQFPTGRVVGPIAAIWVLSVGGWSWSETWAPRCSSSGSS